MEVNCALLPPKINKSQLELSEAARESAIHTFGWPIAIFLQNTDDRPRPRSDGIFANVQDEGHFDYWAWRKNGDFFLFKSIFEDERDRTKLYFNIRIVRVTETLLYLARQYTRLEISPDQEMVVRIAHGGFADRTLGTSNPARMMMRENAPAQEDYIETEIQITVGDIENRLVELIRELTAPLFMMFDFFELDQNIYEQIVNDFVEGRVT